MPMRKLSKGWSTILNKYRNNVVSSRDRNREHAKNTRLRKKAYILKLKQLVEEMKKIKDVEDIERRSFAESVYSKVVKAHLWELF